MEEISAEESLSGRWTSVVTHREPVSAHSGGKQQEEGERANAQSSRSTSAPMLILLVMVWKMRRFSRREGLGNSILRSKRPGRRRAGSFDASSGGQLRSAGGVSAEREKERLTSVSCLLVAMMTLTLLP